VLALLNRRIAAGSLAVFSMATMSANAGLLPERVEKVAHERIAAGTYRHWYSVWSTVIKARLWPSASLVTARRPS
jgi:hypothetical protein